MDLTFTKSWRRSAPAGYARQNSWMVSGRCFGSALRHGFASPARRRGAGSTTAVFPMMTVPATGCGNGSGSHATCSMTKAGLRLFRWASAFPVIAIPEQTSRRGPNVCAIGTTGCSPPGQSSNSCSPSEVTPSAIIWRAAPTKLLRNPCRRGVNMVHLPYRCPILHGTTAIGLRKIRGFIANLFPLYARGSHKSSHANPDRGPVDLHHGLRTPHRRGRSGNSYARH